MIVGGGTVHGPGYGRGTTVPYSRRSASRRAWRSSSRSLLALALLPPAGTPPAARGYGEIKVLNVTINTVAI